MATDNPNKSQPDERFILLSNTDSWDLEDMFVQMSTSHIQLESDVNKTVENAESVLKARREIWEFLRASVLDGGIKLASGISGDIPEVHEDGVVEFEEEWSGQWRVDRSSFLTWHKANRERIRDILPNWADGLCSYNENLFDNLMTVESALVFMRKADFWEIGIQERKYFKHKKGLTYLQFLLSHPRKDYSCHELNLFRHAFQLAVTKWEFITKTPFAKVKLPKGDKKRVRYLSADEETKLFAALDQVSWLRSVVIVARETGLRLSNICNLTWNQVNLFKRYVEIEETKNGKPVWIPLSNLVHTELMKLSKVRDLQSNRVFLVDDKPIHRNRVGLAFRRLVKKAGIENFRFHDLRHDFCSRLIQAGEKLSVVSELAGHSSIITTQRYAHLSPEAKRKAISSLNGFNLASIK